MNKPNNYDNIQTGTEFTPVELGGHYANIIKVEERPTKNGDPMIVVYLDFDKKDAQFNYFANAYDNDTRDEKKWPYQGTSYITAEYKGEATWGLKSFVKAYEDSNNVAVEWGEKFCQQFANKKIGVVFGEVEELYNGEIKARRRIRRFCDYNKVSAQKVPDIKPYPESTPKAVTPSFMSIPDTDNEEVPFN